MTVAAEQSCPLCGHAPATAYASVRRRDYCACPACALVWLTPHQRPGTAEELAEYQLHENDPADPRYRRHLARLTELMLPTLPPKASGLDFGSGPGPAISAMLGEAGFDVTNYDPFFAADPTPLSRSYDFITCTETAEHFHDPGAMLATLARCLKPGGTLGIMTRLHTDAIDFADWYYINELSHVAFYAPETMQFIAARYDWQAEIVLPDIVLFRAPAA